MIEILYDLRLYISFFVIYIIYKIGTYDFTLHKRLNVEGPKPWPYFGNFIQMGRMGPRDFDMMCTKYGDVYPVYLGGVPNIFVSEEQVLKHILVKDFRCFTDRFDLRIGRDTEKFITRLKGKDWERVRNIISPTFTSGKLKNMSPLIKQCVELLINNLKEAAAKPESVDLKEIFGCLTMDVISRTMFGMEIDSQKNPNNKFVVKAKKLFNFKLFSPLILFLFLFPKLGKFLDKLNIMSSVLSSDSLKFFRETASEVIKQRKNSNEKYNDFLELMMKKEVEDNSVNENEAYLSLSEVVAQSVIFLLAGYETTAQTLNFTCYFLAMNPSMQEEVYQEIVDEVGAGEVKYETISKLNMLDAAICESMRICSPAVQLNRECTESVSISTLDGRVIDFQKHDVITIPIQAIHMNPKYWPDPEKYDMHRFDPDKKASMNSYSYMPFGMGPRNCVGMRFAQLEIKWALTNLLIKFELVATEETPKVLEFKKVGLTAPLHPIKLKVIERS